MKKLLLLLAFSPLLALAQSQDGRGWHELPPAMNIVNGGVLLERSAMMQRDATYVAISSLAVGALFLDFDSKPQATAIGSAGIGLSLVVHLRAIKFQRRGARFLQLGYNVKRLYDLVPDSIANEPHLHIR